MKNYNYKENFNIVIKIADQITPHIRANILYNLYKAYATQLIECSALIEAPYLLDIDAENRSVPVDVIGKKFYYFSSRCMWIDVDEANLKVYQVSFDWLLKTILIGFNAQKTCKYSPILDHFIWSLGKIQLKHLNIIVIIVRRLRDDEVYNALTTYLDFQCMNIPTIVIALDNYLPPYLKINHPNILLNIQDILNDDGESKVLFNIDLIFSKIEKNINKNSFSEGYRSAHINGIDYVFF